MLKGINLFLDARGLTIKTENQGLHNTFGTRVYSFTPQACV
jgi:hypothetical protein